VKVLVTVDVFVIADVIVILPEEMFTIEDREEMMVVNNLCTKLNDESHLRFAF